MWRHIVMQRVEKQEDRDFLMKMIKELPEKLDYLHDLECGFDNMHAGNSYDMGFSCSFDTWEDVLKYYDDPVHIALRTELRARRQASAMVDWEVPDK